ncbi:MAG: hypothetical protein ACLU0O_02600 [Collinsella sp.]
MPVNLVSTACLGNLNDPSYELLLRRELGGVFEVDKLLLLDWDQADARTFVGVTELGRTVDIRLGAADGDRLADGDVLAIDRSAWCPWRLSCACAVPRFIWSKSTAWTRLRSRMRAGDRQYARAAFPRRFGRVYRAHVYAGAACFGPHAPGRRGRLALGGYP